MVYVADLSVEKGNAPSAADLLERALAIAEELRNADPGDRRARADVPNVRTKYASTLTYVPLRYHEADEQAQLALEEYEPLAAEFPGRFDARIRRTRDLLAHLRLATPGPADQTP